MQHPGSISGITKENISIRKAGHIQVIEANGKARPESIPTVQEKLPSKKLNIQDLISPLDAKAEQSGKYPNSLG